MFILYLGACPENYLEVRSRIKLEMAKVEFLESLTGRVDFLILGSKSDFRNWNRFVMSFMTCV